MAAQQLSLPRPFGGLLGTQFYAISLPQQTKVTSATEYYDAALALAKSDALNQKLRNESNRGKQTKES